MLGAAIAVQAKTDVKPIYIFGFSASFNDSTVYFTDIQRLDSSRIDSKTHFLAGRDAYANQLRDYFTGRGEANRTCVVTYADSEKDIRKKYEKMATKYIKKGHFDVHHLTAADFRFRAVEPAEVVTVTTAPEKKPSRRPQGPPPAGGKGTPPSGGPAGGTPPSGGMR